MVYKKLEHCIILCLLKQITMIPYVSGRSSESEEMKIFSDCQLAELATEVCSDLELYTKVPPEICERNFRGPDASISNSAVIKIRCQTNYSIHYQIEPLERWQLVVLMPQFTNDCDRFSNPINYRLIQPETEFEDISVTSPRNHTIWRAILKRGVPFTWRGGDELPMYDDSIIPENKTYNINYSFEPNKDNNSIITGTFTWNTSRDGDACFVVVNSCEKSGLKYNDVVPNKNDNQSGTIFKELLVDDDCDIEVKGIHGSTKLTYQTPLCSENNCSEVKPEMADNISLKASLDSLNKWKVRVNWAAPKHFPDSYNITLRASDNYTQTLVVAGNATEAVFSNVTGKWLYNVSIVAVKGRWGAHTMRRGQFPVVHPDMWRGGAGGAGIGVGCVAAAALLMLCRCRRRRHHGALPPYKPDDKPPKDGETEVLEIWSETEDRWEVRADKLVLHEVIGEGAFGVVRRATLAPQSMQVAVKMLKNFPSLDEIRSFRSEMELMKTVGVHPHLVSLVGCCTGRKPLIIAEYCSRGDLLSYLRCTWDVILSKRNVKYYNNNIDNSDYRHDLFKRKPEMENSKLVVNKLYDLQDICDKEITSLDLLSFCRQIAIGMEFLAANRVVHRDLAARNVLVTADRTLKIADFGLSRDVYEENQYKQKGNGKMPVKWMALESLTRKIYTTQSDVWSFGVVVWEIATVGGAPYASVPAARLPRLLRGGYRMPRPNNCSPLLYDIMLSCWRPHPRDRPTFAELHQRLDELLNSACANQYLSLELDDDDTPPTPKHYRYIKMLIRGKRNWSRSENYERPLKVPVVNHNHYTSPPDAQSAHAYPV